jgi:hypothetical protein
MEGISFDFMKLNQLLSGVAALNGFTVMLSMRSGTAAAREYLSKVTKAFRDVSGAGLRVKSPVNYLHESGAVPFSPDTRIQIPSILYGGGGTAVEELVHLAAVARLLRPRVVFEIGTFTGLTTSLFILNAAEGARVISVDLPPDADADNEDYIGFDNELVKIRKVGHYAAQLGLRDRYEQWFCDSMTLDPTPLAGQVELGFIDGAHALPYVVNDTRKMGVMIADHGMVLWHDYGGVGEFRPLAKYLERLADYAPVWRIPATTTAWCMGRDLKKALALAK